MIKTENGNMNQQNSDEPEQFRKLFIGGLDYRTTDDSLKEFYEQWGEIVDVVVMKDPKTRRSRGFGFVTYAQQSMVDEAMSHRPHKVDGREVEAKRAVPRESKPENGVTSKKLFIGGIKDEHDEDALTNYFSEYGKVVSATVAVDKNTDKKRGFAFVEFDDYDPADKVILKGGEHWICGKKRVEAVAGAEAAVEWVPEVVATEAKGTGDPAEADTVEDPGQAEEDKADGVEARMVVVDGEAAVATALEEAGEVVVMVASEEDINKDMPVARSVVAVTVQDLVPMEELPVVVLLVAMVDTALEPEGVQVLVVATALVAVTKKSYLLFAPIPYFFNDAFVQYFKALTDVVGPCYDDQSLIKGQPHQDGPTIEYPSIELNE
ncbi:unnamed protein product [Cyprideis torosa]|uniref:Uncharacterized protein n=1 Tax=Cyprideis torosa TaxID=163714 RepID=A0A7R8ZSQ9_9CRUS|nr:unnamed protein product [Cyprideis torosa]CAG0896096.1 unnamed protein product [Cyprideis torosa]